PRSIQRGFACTLVRRYNRLIGTTFLSEIHQRDVAIALHLLAKLILCCLIHAGSAGAGTNLRNQLQISSDKVRPSVQAHQELFQLVMEELIVLRNLRCGRKVDCRRRFVLRGTAFYSHIQAVKGSSTEYKPSAAIDLSTTAEGL